MARGHDTLVLAGSTDGLVERQDQLIEQVGFDDIELADIVEPAITVVPQRPRELGRRAAEQLFRRIHGDRGETIRDIVESPIVERGSGEIPPPPAT